MENLEVLSFGIRVGDADYSGFEFIYVYRDSIKFGATENSK